MFKSNVIDETKKQMNVLSHYLSRYKDRSEFLILGYRPANIEEINKCRELYQKHILSNTSSLNHDEKRLEIFELEKGKKPKLSVEQLEKLTRFIRPEKTGLLTDLSEALIRLINDSLSARFNSKSSIFEPKDGSIVLFCSELIVWLNKLALCASVKAASSELVKRIDYLREIVFPSVFSPEPKSDYQIQSLIFSLIDHLDEKVRTKIFIELKGQSAYTHFKDLITNSDSFINHTMNGLFYLFSNFSNVEATKFNWILYDENAKKNGELDSYMQCSDLGRMYILMKKNSRFNNFSEKGLSGYRNPFLTDSGEIVSTFGKLLNNKQSENENHFSGLHKFSGGGAHSDANIVRTLVVFLGMLSDFQAFIHGFKLAFDLAMRGGDILILHYMRSETKQIMGRFLNMISELTDVLLTIEKFAYDQAKEFSTEYNQGQYNIFRCEPTEWVEKYTSYADELKLSLKSLEDCQDSINSIRILMSGVNMNSYRNEVSDEINSYRSVVETISKISYRMSPSKKYYETSSNASLQAEPRESKKLKSSMNDRFFQNPKLNTTIFQFYKEKAKQIISKNDKVQIIFDSCDNSSNMKKHLTYLAKIDKPVLARNEQYMIELTSEEYNRIMGDNAHDNLLSKQDCGPKNQK